MAAVNDVEKHCDDDEVNNNDNHRGAVVFNAGEIDRADCYLAPFENITIWYVVTAMLEWPRGAELIFVGYLNAELDRTGGR